MVEVIRTAKRIEFQFIRDIIITIILVIILFIAIADTGPDVGSAADNITAQSDVYPLTSFFKKKGIILLAFMASVAIIIIVSMLKSVGK